MSKRHLIYCWGHGESVDDPTAITFKQLTLCGQCASELIPILQGKGEQIPYGEIIDCWNRVAKIHNLCQCRITNKRRVSIRARWKENAFRASWWMLMQKDIPRSPLLLGFNDRGWQIDMTWLLKNDTNYVKVLEGKYHKKIDAALTDAGGDVGDVVM